MALGGWVLIHLRPQQGMVKDGIRSGVTGPHGPVGAVSTLTAPVIGSSASGWFFRAPAFNSLLIAALQFGLSMCRLSQTTAKEAPSPPRILAILRVNALSWREHNSFVSHRITGSGQYGLFQSCVEPSARPPILFVALSRTCLDQYNTLRII